jgi:hypothetical protein
VERPWIESSRICHRKPRGFSGAGVVVDEAILDSLDALVANESANLENVETENILRIGEEDSASIVLKKASILRRLGESTAAETAYEVALSRSALLKENEDSYRNAYKYTISAESAEVGCAVLIFGYDSDVSPIARGEIITTLDGVPFAKYRDYSSYVSELIPGAVNIAGLVTLSDGKSEPRVQEATTEQLKLLKYIIL